MSEKSNCYTIIQCKNKNTLPDWRGTILLVIERTYRTNLIRTSNKYCNKYNHRLCSFGQTNQLTKRKRSADAQRLHNLLSQYTVWSKKKYVKGDKSGQTRTGKIRGGIPGQIRANCNPQRPERDKEFLGEDWKWRLPSEKAFSLEEDSKPSAQSSRRHTQCS